MSKKRKIDYYKSFDAEYQKKQAFEEDKKRFNNNGIYGVTNSRFDEDGYDMDGYNKDGFNRAGLHRLTGKSVDENGLNVNKEKPKEAETKKELTSDEIALMLSEGQITTLEFIKTSQMPIDDLIKYAKESKMAPKVIRDLYARRKEYQLYTKPFDKEEYLKISKVKKGDEIITPTAKNVDDCLDYMNNHEMYVCDKTAREIINGYIRGDIDLSKTPTENRTRDAILKDKQRAVAELQAKVELARKKSIAAEALKNDYKDKSDKER